MDELDGSGKRKLCLGWDTRLYLDTSSETMDDTISDIPSVELNMEQFEDHDADDGGSGDESGGKCHLNRGLPGFPQVLSRWSSPGEPRLLEKFGLCIDDNV